jgi:hypothetical protein
MDEEIRRLQREAERIAARHNVPDFYIRFKAPIALARKLYHADPLVARLRNRVSPFLKEDLGHGLYHCSRVGLDAATLICIETQVNRIERRRGERLMMLGLFAGLLHDICRGEEKHAEAGAVEAERLLEGFPLHQIEIACICTAIRNHEAFTSPSPFLRPWFKLVSDSLYDADKFRWGRDTFTHTIWHMIDHQRMTPRELITKFPWGMTGVLRIRETFRSTTGRHFGPQIIETGMEIGKEIYHFLRQRYPEHENAQ